MNVKGTPGSKERLLEMFQNVNKLKINEDAVHHQPESDPFGGAKEELQNGSGYIAGHPVNPEMRVSSDDKFVKEQKWGEGGKFKDYDGVMKWSDEVEEEPVNEIGIEGDNTGRMMSPHESDIAMQAVYNLLDRNEPVTKETIQQEFIKIAQMNEGETPDEEPTVEPEGEEDVPPTDSEDGGDQIEGGLADDSSVSEFDSQQILKGIEVEMEHTSDPKIAVEIAMDHLKEIPDYYTRLDTMEKEAGVEDGEEGGGLPGVDSNPDGTPIPSIDPPVNPSGCLPPAELPAEMPDELKGHAEVLQDDDDELKDALLGFDLETPNAANESHPIVGDDDEMGRYNELNSMDFNSMPDEDKEEFFTLWQKYGTRQY